MKTDDLIAALSREVEPASRTPLMMRTVMALLGGGAVSLLLMHLTLGVRPDIGVAMWAVAAKAGFCAVLAVAGGAAALKLGRPGRSGRALAPWLALVACGFLVAAVTLASMEPGLRWGAWTGGGIPWCVVLIPAFALPVATGLVWAWREAAPTGLTMAGAAIGALAGAVGALVYAMHCPIDSVPFVAAWYGVGIGLTAGIGALLGRWFLRW